MPLPCIRETIPPEGWFGLIRPFGLLVGTGVVLGYHWGRNRAKAVGLDPDVCANGMVWAVATGFVVAHLVSVVFYFPDKLLREPLLLFKLWENLSSFGGFIGGLAGSLYFFKVKQRSSLLAYSEPMLFALVVGWVFGRMGCTVVHDHPGLPTDFALGVACGPGGSVRHDLGFYELLFTLALVLLLFGLRRVRPFIGFHQALVLALYAPVRFAMDFLRIDDRKYLGLTPGQYFAVTMLLGAFALTYYGLRLKRAGIASPEALVASTAARRPNAGAARKKKRRSNRRRR
jgi:phosphatidylglycerol:prolipoprotein diacylglycerol transferase